VNNLDVPIQPAAPFAHTSIDECIEKAHVQSAEADHRPIMYRCSFPRKAAGQVLWWLAKERITATSLFPGYDGVARAVFELELQFKPLGSTLPRPR
jgi:hypothetical protein